MVGRRRIDLPCLPHTGRVRQFPALFRQDVLSPRVEEVLRFRSLLPGFGGPSRQILNRQEVLVVVVVLVCAFPRGFRVMVMPLLQN